MKVLFLDFDGVLNSAKFLHENHEEIKKANGGSFLHRHIKEIDPVAFERVRRIVETTNSKIVISSSWRILHPIEEINEMFKIHGWDNPPIIDYTPRIMKSGSIRGDEIQSWIDNQKVEKLTTYVCLDDDNDFHDSQNLVQTTWQGGIQEEHVDAALYYLSLSGKEL